MELLNEVNRKTWQRKRKSGVLNLSWISEEMTTRTRWTIGEKTGWDHALIQIDIETGGDHLRAIKERLQYRRTRWEEVREEVEKAVHETKEEWKSAKDKRDHQTMVTILEEVLRKGIYKGTPVERMSWRSKKWFDEEVKDKRKEM